MIAEKSKINGEISGILVSAEDRDGSKVELKSLWKENPVILFFYPKDNTPGCTTEAQNFRDSLGEIRKAGFTVIGISKDNVKSHCKFIDKQELNFPLLSDESGELSEFFEVWVEKSMYGKKYMGIQRSTFIIEKGIVVKVFEKVKVKEHAKEILEYIRLR